MNRTLIFIEIIILALFASCTQTPEVSSKWRGPQSNGIYPETHLLDQWPEQGPELIWSTDILGPGYASVAALTDKIVTIGTLDSINYIFAFNHQGQELYRSKLDSEWSDNFPGSRSTPIIQGDHGYFLSGLGDLYCFTHKDGAIVWKINLFTDYDGRNVFYGITDNLLVDGDLLYCIPGGEDSNVIALNRFNGKMVWQNKGNGGTNAYNSPTMIVHNGKKFLITVTSKTVMSMQADDGELAWKYEFDTVHGNRSNLPIYKDGQLLVMGAYGVGSFMLQLNETGNSVEKLWQNDSINCSVGGAVVIGNDIYIGSGSRIKKLYCVDWNTGKNKYSIPAIPPLVTISADGLIYSLSFRGKLKLIKPGPDAFEICGEFEVPADGERMFFAHPVIKDKRLYIRINNRLNVYSIEKNTT